VPPTLQVPFRVPRDGPKASVWFPLVLKAPSASKLELSSSWTEVPFRVEYLRSVFRVAEAPFQPNER
jgi:hypothetical protein